MDALALAMSDKAAASPPPRVSNRRRANEGNPADGSLLDDAVERARDHHGIRDPVTPRRMSTGCRRGRLPLVVRAGSFQSPPRALGLQRIITGRTRGR